MIPRILHRIWVGDRAMPDSYQAWGRQWRDLHPGWTHILWTDVELPVGEPWLDLARLPTPASRADVIRLQALHALGGVYVDCDVEPVKPLDPLLEALDERGCRAFAGTEDDVLVSIGVLGAVAGHPLFEACRVALPGWWLAHKERTTDVQTGPRFFSAVVWDRLERGEETLEVLPRPAFYPYSYDELHRMGESFPDSWAVHHWGSMRDRAVSWRTEAQFAEDRKH